MVEFVDLETILAAHSLTSKDIDFSEDAEPTGEFDVVQLISSEYISRCDAQLSAYMRKVCDDPKGNPNSKLRRATAGSAAYDLAVPCDITIPAGHQVTIPFNTTFHNFSEETIQAAVTARSSLFKHYGLVPLTTVSFFQQEQLLMFSFLNSTKEDVMLYRNTRVAQVTLIKHRDDETFDGDIYDIQNQQFIERSSLLNYSIPVFAREDIILQPHKQYLIDTQISVKFDKHYVCWLMKDNLPDHLIQTNGLGVIDSDYFHEDAPDKYPIKLPLYNAAYIPRTIYKGDYIGFMGMREVVFDDSEPLSAIREGGFGSTS